MILVWNGEAIEAIDMDKVFPGPRAEEVAGLLEPGYLRGYLEGRKAVVGKKEIREKGRVGKGLRQIQRLINQPIAEPKMAAPWRYAMFLKEMILEKSPQPEARPQSVGEPALQPVDAVAAQMFDTETALPVDAVAPQPVDTVTALLNDVETSLPVDAATQPTGAEGGEHAPTDGKPRGKAKRRRRKAKRHPSPERQSNPEGGEQQSTGSERQPDPKNGEQPPNPKPPTSPKGGEQPPNPKDEEQPPNPKDEKQPPSPKDGEQPPDHAEEAKRKHRRRRKTKHRPSLARQPAQAKQTPDPKAGEQPPGPKPPTNPKSGKQPPNPKDGEQPTNPKGREQPPNHADEAKRETGSKRRPGQMQQSAQVEKPPDPKGGEQPSPRDVARPAKKRRYRHHQGEKSPCSGAPPPDGRSPPPKG